MSQDSSMHPTMDNMTSQYSVRFRSAHWLHESSALDMFYPNPPLEPININELSLNARKILYVVCEAALGHIESPPGTYLYHKLFERYVAKVVFLCNVVGIKPFYNLLKDSHDDFVHKLHILLYYTTYLPAFQENGRFYGNPIECWNFINKHESLFKEFKEQHPISITQAPFMPMLERIQNFADLIPYLFEQIPEIPQDILDMLHNPLGDFKPLLEKAE